MKRFFRYVCCLGALALCLAACNKEDLKYKKGEDENGNPVENGKLSLSGVRVDVDLSSVTAVSPGTVAGINPEDFTVRLVSVATGNTVNTWKKSELVPVLDLAAGKYLIEAFYPAVRKAAAWEEPYLYGRQEIEVSGSKTAKAGVLSCTLANMAVLVDGVVTKGEAAEEIRDYRVTVSNKDGGVLSFTQEETRTAYFSVSPLTVSVTGTRTNGIAFGYSRSITQVAPGDVHKISIELSMTGELQSPLISIDATTNDKEVSLGVPVEDEIIEEPAGPDGPDDPTPPDVPGGKGPTIVGENGLDLTQDIVLGDGETRDVDVLVTAENGGIASLKVTILSDMLESVLPSVGLAKMMDLTNPGTMAENLKTLGLIGDDPIQGKTSYRFSITKFTPILSSMAAYTHQFKVDLKDGAGGTVSRTITIVVQK